METKTQTKASSVGVELATATIAHPSVLIVGYYILITIHVLPYQTQSKACDILLKSFHFG